MSVFANPIEQYLGRSYELRSEPTFKPIKEVNQFILALKKDSQNKLEHPLNFGNVHYQLPVTECECRMRMGLDCSYVRNLQYGESASLLRLCTCQFL